MRSFILLFTILACALALGWSVPLEERQENNEAAERLLDVDSGIEHSSEGVRKARQFYGYYGYPFYGGYGGYYRPYYGGYGFGYYGYHPYYGYGGFYG